MNRSIVINREFGSGGREIGRLISERTGMELYDTRVLQEAASRRGLPADLLADFDERVASGPYFDLSAFMGFDSETFSLPYRMYSAIAEVITEAAQVAPAVFIGRCADRILQDAGLRLVSVFVYSSDVERKVARAVEVDGVPARDAEKYIAKMDKTRDRYQQFFTGTRFGDYREYDLCLNSGRLGYQACVDLILAAEAAPEMAAAQPDNVTPLRPEVDR
ncbi:MAG: cytidylate kinase-like family protein [Propionicimonas sp.]|uniref:cytidylate kinase-like family protein n=1 Tax=Propionicimonas sp. TaxID=1955623 RepID=UPI002B20DCA8|nr:cytidylate kinase-like family protein [Propionicimonas sp.]MEA4945606.1 cytidylate kinase-like family protein [Propionicimonas sp.]MEA5053311.1 cytidylate kinase-like family protein [Propionicimonas sp.]MEA5118041.1 cytidylate kinase-like family protein [Propionicimonas sp.]